MSRTLSIPVRQTITLPDNWQACRTPQELSYWLISQFDEFEHNVETLAADVAALQSGLSELQTDVGNIDVRLVTIESQMNAVIASIGTIDEQINDQTTGILARLTLLEQSYSGLSYDVASLDNTVNAPTTGLAARVTAIETDLTAIHDALISQGTDIAALKPDVETLKTTVGDSTSGLVKKVNDLDTEINGANGIDDRVTALEQSGGSTKYNHHIHLQVNLAFIDISIINNSSTPFTTTSLITYLTSLPIDTNLVCSGYVNTAADYGIVIGVRIVSGGFEVKTITLSGNRNDTTYSSINNCTDKVETI